MEAGMLASAKVGCMAVDSSTSTAPPSEARPIGVEAGKTIARKIEDGFVARYLSGAAILDIGYRGYIDNAIPVVPQAIGVELDYPGYDGRTLPFADHTQDAVFASHCLEHIEDYRNAFREWHRVLKIGGFIVIAVPHKFLYEKRTGLPSRWNEDHKRFYTPASLMAEVEASLPPNTYRLRHLIDNDFGYDYTIPPSRHAGGCYEIELVLERIVPPAWQLEDPPVLVGPRPLVPPQPPRRLRTAVVAVWGVLPGPLKRLLPRSLRSAGAAVLWR
jgi:SAM-dependent methyltransferase